MTLDEQPMPEADVPGVDPTKTHQIRELKHERPLLGCRYNAAGTVIVAGSQDNHVVRWDLATGKKTVLAGHDSWVRAVGFAATGELLSGGYDGRLIWWEDSPDSTQPKRTLPAHDGWIQCLDFSPDGTLVATCGNDRLVKVFDVASGQQVAELTGHESDVYSVLFHPGGKFLLSGDLVGSIRQWDLSTGEQVRTLNGQALDNYHASQRVHYGGVRCLAFDADASRLVAGGLHKASNPLGAVQEPLVLQFDWESGELRQQLEAGETTRLITWRTIYHGDGFLIAVVGSVGGFLLFFRDDDTQPFHKHKIANSAFDGDLHPHGLHIATAHHDGNVRISQLAPGTAERSGS